jgi:RNA polymerase sigma factor (TIGR02999 family)
MNDGEGRGPESASVPLPAGVTDLLTRWQGGDIATLERLIPLVYRELRQLAQGYLRQERSGHTLQSTALVHEAYLRLAAQESLQVHSRAHFLAIAARVMRHVLVDYARNKEAGKRGSNPQKVTLSAIEANAAPTDVDVVALDDALEALAAIDPQQAQVVELRFFAGLSIEETAETLDISEATVKRDWSTARAWLYRELDRTSPP